MRELLAGASGRDNAIGMPSETHASTDRPDSIVLPAARSFAPAYAALDLGTNNCRLLIGAQVGEGFRVVDSFSRIVRLGEGLHHSGRLSDEAMERTMEALRCCAARLARRPLRGIRAVATQACRQASNSAAFLERVEREIGLHFDIITAREEAALVLDSCAPLLATGCRRALLFDIGGGSTELVWVRMGADGPELAGYVSLPVGVVTLADRFGSAGFDPEGFAAMVNDVTERLVPFEQVHRIGQEIRQGGVRLLGTSGTITTLAGIVLALKQYSRPAVDGVVLTREAAQGAIEELRAMGRAGLAAHPCVGADRADFVLPGCAIFAAIQSLWPVPEVMVADRGLREGLLIRLIRADRARDGLRPGRPAIRTPWSRG
jgi:exopolyphosphatase/guanosine-5'-triphosphate,3'-diphosphate pyrophosphatase